MPVRDRVVDSTPIPWEKGTGLIELKHRGIIEEMLGQSIDWDNEVEIHGDNFTGNDRRMAEVLPRTTALSVGLEDRAKCPSNIGDR